MISESSNEPGRLSLPTLVKSVALADYHVKPDWNTGWGILWQTWVGLTLFLVVPLLS